MEGLHSMIFRRSIAFFFPLATCILKIDGAYIHTCNYDGMFMSVFDNGSWSCLPCRQCPDGYRIIQPCKYNSDTVCEKCPPETYMTEDRDECQPCSKCPPGYYVYQYCQNYQDRKCKACAQGYFSRRWNSLSCRRCKSCQPKEVVLRPCSGHNDSLCGDCDKDHYRESSTWQCRPCSECEGDNSVKVKECIRKKGDNSKFICQLQAFIFRANGPKTDSTPAISSKVMADPRENITDMLSFTVYSLITVLVLLCIVFVPVAVFYLHRCLCRERYQLRRPSRELTVQTRYIHLSDVYIKQSAIMDKKDYAIKQTTPIKSDKHATSEQTIEISDADLSDKWPRSQKTVLWGSEETYSLIKHEKSPRRKKKKRSLRFENWQSECDIASYNRYTALENAKFTTI